MLGPPTSCGAVVAVAVVALALAIVTVVVAVVAVVVAVVAVAAWRSLGCCGSMYNGNGSRRSARTSGASRERGLLRQLHDGALLLVQNARRRHKRVTGNLVLEDEGIILGVQLHWAQHRQPLPHLAQLGLEVAGHCDRWSDQAGPGNGVRGWGEVLLQHDVVLHSFRQ